VELVAGLYNGLVV
jgi:dynein intermediate chain 2